MFDKLYIGTRYIFAYNKRTQPDEENSMFLYIVRVLITKAMLHERHFFSTSLSMGIDIET